jgi:hypothetical protein
MQNVNHTQLNTFTKIRDVYTTRDRSINVDTSKETGDITVEVTLFSPVADRVFDRLEEKQRNEWAQEFFNGENAPLIQEYKLVRKGY